MLDVRSVHPSRDGKHGAALYSSFVFLHNSFSRCGAHKRREHMNKRQEQILRVGEFVHLGKTKRA
jgi:hypothetical protein